MKSEMIPVVITTDKDKRGVFFGYINPKDFENENIKMIGAQMTVHWSSSSKGVLGLISSGPDENCRITPKNDNTFFIKGVTLVSTISPEAEKKWLAAPWSK